MTKDDFEYLRYWTPDSRYQKWVGEMVAKAPSVSPLGDEEKALLLYLHKMNKYTFEEYRKVVAHDGETEFMADDPAGKRVREWLLSDAMKDKIRKCYDEGIPPHDVMDTIGWDDYPYETW